MRTNYWLALSAIFCVAIVAVDLVSVEERHGGGHHGHHGHHGHGFGGRRNRTQCYQAQQFISQWWPQSALISAFQTVCRLVGPTQTWSLLQGLLGVPATGVLDQTTFQALLNTANINLLAQQLLTSVGAVVTVSPIIGK